MTKQLIIVLMLILIIMSSKSSNATLIWDNVDIVDTRSVDSGGPNPWSIETWSNNEDFILTEETHITNLVVEIFIDHPEKYTGTAVSIYANEADIGSNPLFSSFIVASLSASGNTRGAATNNPIDGYTLDHTTDVTLGPGDYWVGFSLPTTNLYSAFGAYGTGLDNIGPGFIHNHPTNPLEHNVTRTGDHLEFTITGDATTPTPTPTPIRHPTPTPTPISNGTPTPTPISNGTPTPTPISNGTPTPTPTPTPILTPGTEIGGIISEDTTFTLADSPFDVTSSLVVNEDVTLIIEPGVILRFSENTLLLVNGELIAKGTVSQHIVFTSFASNWLQIKFSNIAKPAIYDVNFNFISGSIMEFCIVENTIGAVLQSNLSIVDIAPIATEPQPVVVNTPTTEDLGAIRGVSPPFINNCIIRNNKIGIVIFRSNIPVKISNNIMTKNEIISIYGEASSDFQITGNIIEGNGGIEIEGDDITIADNSITKCEAAIEIRSSSRDRATINNNTISNNRDGVILNRTGKAIISGNIIKGNVDRGIIAQDFDFDEILIKGNDITQNGKEKTLNGGAGIQISDSGTVDTVDTVVAFVNNNNIFDNAGFSISNLTESGTINFDATNNWWGTTELNSINECIFDFFDDPTLSIVNIAPIATKPQPVVVVITPTPTSTLITPTPTPTLTPEITPILTPAEKPIANFIADQTLGPPPLEVQFTDLSTGGPTGWFWDFGDGSASIEQNATHTYRVEGMFTVTLTVSNASGSDSQTRDNLINVTPKSFTFNCENSMKQGPIFGLEKLTMNVGDTENCILKLTNYEQGKTVEVSSLRRRGFMSAIKIEPARSVTDENGELEITITAIRKGRDWAAWAVQNDRGQFKFNKKTYDTGLAWGMFVEVK